MYTRYTCIYTIYTSNAPLNTLYTPHIHPLYALTQPIKQVLRHGGLDALCECLTDYNVSIRLLALRCIAAITSPLAQGDPEEGPRREQVCSYIFQSSIDWKYKICFSLIHIRQTNILYGQSNTYFSLYSINVQCKDFR